MSERIAWIGIGNLATPIVRRLIAAGHRPMLFDLRAELLAPFEGEADLAGSAAEAAGAADLVFSTLPSDKALEAVGAEVLPAIGDGVFCDMSTVSPEASSRVAAIGDYVRAPVSGSVAHAEQGILTVIASGPEAAYQRLAPIFELFSAQRYHVGEAEEARYLKLVINNLVGSTAALMAESLAMGSKAGLDWQRMLEVIANSAVASPLVKYKAGPLAERDFSPAFTTELMIKDMSLFRSAAETLRCPTPLAAETESLLREHAANGGGQEDFFALVKLLEAKSNN
ncbi:MAG: NAD(P)-dependent oxidoreductase [Pseudomonadota bacterium]